MTSNPLNEQQNEPIGLRRLTQLHIPVDDISDEDIVKDIEKLQDLQKIVEEGENFDLIKESTKPKHNDDSGPTTKDQKKHEISNPYNDFRFDEINREVKALTEVLRKDSFQNPKQFYEKVQTFKALHPDFKPRHYDAIQQMLKLTPKSTDSPISDFPREQTQYTRYVDPNTGVEYRLVLKEPLSDKPDSEESAQPNEDYTTDVEDQQSQNVAPETAGDYNKDDETQPMASVGTLPQRGSSDLVDVRKKPSDESDAEIVQANQNFPIEQEQQTQYIEQENPTFDTKQEDQNFNTKQEKQNFDIKQENQNFDIKQQNQKQIIKQENQNFDIKHGNEKFDSTQEKQIQNVQQENQDQNPKQEVQSGNTKQEKQIKNPKQEKQMKNPKQEKQIKNPKQEKTIKIPKQEKQNQNTKQENPNIDTKQGKQTKSPKSPKKHKKQQKKPEKSPKSASKKGSKKKAKGKSKSHVSREAKRISDDDVSESRLMAQMLKAGRRFHGNDTTVDIVDQGHDKVALNVTHSSSHPKIHGNRDIIVSGCVVAGVGVLLILAAMVYLFVNRRRRKKFGHPGRKGSQHRYQLIGKSDDLPSVKGRNDNHSLFPQSSEEEEDSDETVYEYH